MPHRIFLLTICNPAGALKRLVLDNPPQIRIIDREAALDEVDNLLRRARARNDKESIHMILDIGYWIGTWPTGNLTGRPIAY